MSLGQHPGMADGLVLSWAFPNGTNPSTASVFVAQLKPSGSSVRIQALYVLASYLLLTLGAGAVFIYQVRHCQKVGFVSTGG